MDLPLTATDRRAAKRDLSRRFRLLALETFGEEGGPILAQMLDVPHRTLQNYLGGVAVPGDVLLAFIVLTSASPLWLLTGVGPRRIDRS